MEPRKRRIQNRSSDRFGLITGRLRNLDTASPPSTPISQNPNNIIDSSHVTKSGPPPVWDNANTNNPQAHEQYHGAPAPQQSHLAPQQPHLGSEEEIQVSESSAMDTRIVSTKTSDDEDMFPKPGVRTNFLSCFTAKEINSGILSSEDTRVFCSIMIALLVVIAYANLPRHIVKSESLIGSRPLYVLLLTDAMIIILRVTYAKHTDSGDHVVEVKSKQAVNLQEGESDDNWEGAIKLMEWGLVLYQTVRGVFIDCSFYMVIVICGFCFM